VNSVTDSTEATTGFVSYWTTHGYASDVRIDVYPQQFLDPWTDSKSLFPEKLQTGTIP